MKPTFTLALTACVIAALLAVGSAQQGQARPGELTIEQRGKMIFRALLAQPIDKQAIGKALVDIGHVELSYRSRPLSRWVDGARVIEGRIHLGKVVGLNRDDRGDPPKEWIERLCAPLSKGLQPQLLKLALAPTPQVRARRDRLLALADAKIRAGLLELAKKYPALNKTNWGTLQRALEGTSPPGRISIWAGYYHGGSTGLKQPVPKPQRFNVFVLLRPLHWPVPAGQWKMQPMYSRLALMGQAFADAGDPELRGELRKLISDALTPLERLNDRAAGRMPATTPATAPTGP